jgi:hypothetical protein
MTEISEIEDTDEYQQGAAARRRGDTESSCPYPRGGDVKETERRFRWKQGWMQAGLDLPE